MPSAVPEFEHRDDTNVEKLRERENTEEWGVGEGWGGLDSSPRAASQGEEGFTRGASFELSLSR